MLRTSLQLHKWIGLVVGLQVLFWVLGGLIMTALPIEKVRGEQHIAFAAKPAIALDTVLPLTDVAEKAGFEVASANLRSTPRGPVWIVTAPSGQELWFDARNGEEVQEITAGQARAAAAKAYSGKGEAQPPELFDDPPPEAGAGGPLWRVRFDDGEGTSLWLDPFTGDVVSRRSDLWRFYDFFYRLHIMNFGASENYNHPTIVAASALALAIVVTGFILLWIRLSRDFAMWRARSRRG